MRWLRSASTRSAPAAASFLLVASIAVGGCANADELDPVALCDGPTGSWTNLDSESENFRTDPQDRIDWTDEAGCAVNMNFVFHTFGDDHCGWEDAEFISIGVPIGVPYSGPEATPPGQDWEPKFFHNTDAAVAAFDAGTFLDQLPTDAVDTGLRSTGDRELWISASDDELYVKENAAIRVFVSVADDDVSCA